MLKKKILAFTLSFLLLMTFFTGCTGGGMKDGTRYFADKASGTALRVCIDTELPEYTFPEMNVSLSQYLKDFAQDIKAATGIESVSIEYLPKEGAERKSAVSRLRTEIMAGGGPDVFIMNTIPGYYEFDTDPDEAVFNLLEKNMDAGMFLPLDEYMENNTQFTDWDNQVEAILAASRTEEGQVVIPLSYEVPVTVYPRDKVTIEPSKDLTMQDILNDPDTAELGAVLYDCKSVSSILGETSPMHHLAYILGDLVDYENEKLLFTEEELLQAIDTILAQQEISKNNPYNYSEADSGIYSLCYELSVAYYDTEMALVSMHTMDGGIPAAVKSYAAVNRSTKFPEAAFTVIDMIMQEGMQMESEFYNYFIIPLTTFPMQKDLLSEEKPVIRGTEDYAYLDTPYFEDFCAIRDQITSVGFYNTLNVILEELFFRCWYEHETTGTYSKELVSETYAIMKRMVGE